MRRLKHREKFTNWPQDPKTRSGRAGGGTQEPGTSLRSCPLQHILYKGLDTEQPHAASNLPLSHDTLPELVLLNRGEEDAEYATCLLTG